MTSDQTDKDYVQLPLRTFLDDAAAGQPTPGGGAISALAGALGVTMARMAGNFTLGKKKYADRAEAVGACMKKLHTAQEMLEKFTAEDMAAFRLYQAANRLAADDPDKPNQQKAALAAALSVPGEIVATCAVALAQTAELAPLANPFLLSDVGVAAVLVEAAARAASLNVRVNLAYMDDADEAQRVRATVDEQLGHARDALAKVMAVVDQKF